MNISVDVDVLGCEYGHILVIVGVCVGVGDNGEGTTLDGVGLMLVSF